MDVRKSIVVGNPEICSVQINLFNFVFDAQFRL